MKMALDLAASDGFGYCAELLPEVLTRNEWGLSHCWRRRSSLPRFWAPPDEP